VAGRGRGARLDGDDAGARESFEEPLDLLVEESVVDDCRRASSGGLQLTRPRIHGQAQRLESFDAEHWFRTPPSDQRGIASLAPEELDDHRPDPHRPMTAVGQLDSDRSRRSDDAEALGQIRWQGAVRGAGINEDAHARGTLPGQLRLDEDVTHCRYANDECPPWQRELLA
jgi:hypothetical protein